MRNAFAQVLTDLAKSDDSIALFYADIGNRLFNDLKEVAPTRTINAGIAEANMASMAAGAAKMGLKPFIYTITPFTTARNFEQIKIDIAYSKQPVIIVGTGSGLSYANLGPTHHSFEDIALMRALPNMTIVCPADSLELKALMPKLLDVKGLVFFRIGKKNEPLVHEELPQLEVGKAFVMKEGEKIAILATGTIFPVANLTFDLLKQAGFNPELVSFHTIKPLDTAYLAYLAETFDHVVTIEEHNVNGGFGSAVLEWMSEQSKAPRVHRFGIPDEFIDQVHSQDDARAKVGLTGKDIFNKLINNFK
ncbi:transketolase family protein [Pseudoalteromonas xiamenensis]|uniref:Transketolase n=1 Tax=Pseudoalteromonas xiamenensis TaxID=882626 RepID=A0A975DIR3_9GAMM|nr:transketolase C-terminal domain-containing protein [Pseudoalteromonas xiamenensis]QTH71046.1 transketolase [Pseudoalteromonas xiamenensis]